MLAVKIFHLGIAFFVDCIASKTSYAGSTSTSEDYGPSRFAGYVSMTFWKNLQVSVMSEILFNYNLIWCHFWDGFGRVWNHTLLAKIIEGEIMSYGIDLVRLLSLLLVNFLLSSFLIYLWTSSFLHIICDLIEFVFVQFLSQFCVYVH